MSQNQPRPKVVVRHAEPADHEAIHRIFSSPGAIRGTLQLPYPMAERTRKRVAEPPEGLYALVAVVEGEVVGQLGLNTFPNRPRRRHVGQIGMAVRDDWQGKGIGSALIGAACDFADRWLNLLRLELEVYTDNAAAIHLYQKYGFAIEGTLPLYAFRDGQYVDAYFMGRVRQSAAPR